MDELTFPSGSEAQIHFSCPTFLSDAEIFDCDVALSAVGLRVSTKTYCDRVEEILAFFDAIANHERGWAGVWKVETMDGALSFSASFHRTGSINMDVQLRPRDFTWRVETSVSIPSGEAPEIAKNLRKFMLRGS